MKHTAKYRIDSKTISIYRAGSNVEFVHSTHPLFESLKTFLPRSTEFDVDLNSMDNDRLLEVAARVEYSQLISSYQEWHEGKEMSGRVLSTVPILMARIKALELKQAPTIPLLNFWRRLTTNLEASILTDVKVKVLLETVGSAFIPLTWDGNCVAYRRGGFTEVPALDRPDWANTQVPKRKPVNQYLCPLDKIVETCADLGVLNEVLVKPEDIIDFSMANGLYVKAGKLLGSVPENYLSRCGDNGLVEIHTQIDEFGKCLYIRRPLDVSSAEAAADLGTKCAFSETNCKQELAVNLSC
jgi:hypothetical protein